MYGRFLRFILFGGPGWWCHACYAEGAEVTMTALPIGGGTAATQQQEAAHPDWRPCTIGGRAWPFLDEHPRGYACRGELAAPINGLAPPRPRYLRSFRESSHTARAQTGRCSQ